MKSVEELLKLPSFALAELYLFQNFATREEVPPALQHLLGPFNAAFPVKPWCDPQAPNSWGQPAMYDRALVLTSGGQPALADPASKTPKVHPLVLPGALARMLNIPPTNSNPEVVGFVPCPFAPVPEGCVLEAGLGGSVSVVNKAHPLWAKPAVEEQLKTLQGYAEVTLKNLLKLMEKFGLKEV